MPCPHNEITIVQRSQRQSAVAAAAYQSGEKLFCEYDQQVKHYPEKRGIVHNEILLPANAPPEYADRNTLWNAAEAVEKQWNSQLARRWVLTIPREIPPDQYAVLVREFCEQQFVSKGMIADFAIHDPHPPGHNPHAHVMLTMRAMDEHGKWLPKSRKVYDLDENGERIKLPSGRWKSHKEDTVDWNDQKYCEIWRHEWEVIQNRYLEANDRPERVDLRSYARQGLDIIPTVHEGAAVRQMEKRGIQTNIGNLNREIRAANRLMKSIRQLIQNLKGWITELGEKRKELLAQKAAEEATLLPNLLMKYMEIRKEERKDWTRAGQNRGTSQDLKAVSEALSYLRQKGLSTVEDLEAFLESSGKSAADYRSQMKPKEARSKVIDGLLSARTDCKECKDFIAPSSFAFPTGRYFQIGEMYGCMSFLSIDASDISDRLLADFLSMESSQIVTMHIQSVDQNEAIKTIKHTITELDRSKIEEQKKAVRAGYDMDIIPSDLATYGKDAKALLKELQSQNERMFLLTFLVMNTGKTKQELENNVFQAASIAQKHNCNLIRLDYQQEQGLMSTLPLANNLIEIQRGMTTSSTAIFVPFTTQELFQRGNEALYYGLNALSNNMIMVDRKKLKNPNALILGTPGSGKSFSAKREIANSFLVTDDDIIISDPESEYSPLVARFGGQVIKISPTSDQYINPMDINMNYSDDDNPIALKADFILSLCELIVGNKDGLRPVEKTVIDRCIRQIYQKYFENPGPENMPILGDLYEALLSQEEPEAKHVATALEIYVSGSLNVFNHRTNVELTNRLVCYDIKDLGKQLKKIGMLVVQDQVWGRVTENRIQGRSTRYYMDEMHLLLREDQTAAYTVEIWKRFRKWGGIPTGITQNVKDLLASKEVENIFENSDFIYMLNQAVGDRQILAKQLNISPHQLSYVTHSGEGEGLLFYGNVILPFVDRFPANTELYRIMTTRLSEVAETKKEQSA